MKILFASDLSFNYFPALPPSEQTAATMAETAKLFGAADFSIINLENIFGDPEAYAPIEKSGPNLISDEGFCAYLDALNPTVVGLANNHAGDYGAGALLYTKDLLEQKGYTVIGAGKSVEEAYRPALLEQGEEQVAVIAVCENEFGCADGDSAGSAGYHLTRVTRAIRDARKVGARPVIYFHGGNEHNPFPSPGKVALYRHFIDLGAAAVIAMHTHCPQGYEWYEGCPIVYSMGNFFFPSEGERPTWGQGYMALWDTVENTLEPLPYTFDFDHHTPMSGAEKEQFLQYLSALNAPIHRPAELQAYFDGWCMIAGRNKYLKNLTDGVINARMKNALSCEAHNELLTNTLKILFEGREAEAERRIPEIEKLQKGET
ncbi:MAG: CapA family protein [Clostridia bacterium]|nr:CapA family protein [Clostridia bacterium]